MVSHAGGAGSSLPSDPARKLAFHVRVSVGLVSGTASTILPLFQLGKVRGPFLQGLALFLPVSVAIVMLVLYTT